MFEEDELDALAPAIRRRDSDAFVRLYDLMAGELLAFAQGHLRYREVAAEVVQSTFLQLARHGPRFRGGGRGLVAWLFATTRRACVDHHRHLTTPDPDPGSDDPAGTRSASVRSPATVHDPELARAMDQLTESQRTALLLRRVIGLAADDVARIMHLDRDAASALCRRAEAALGRTLAATAVRDPVTVARPEGGA